MAQDNTIEIDTRLGRRTVQTDKIIHFPRGLAGFEKEHEFVLLQVQPNAPLLVLQSISNPHVGLLVADPYSFQPSYPVTIGDADQALLRLRHADDAAVLVTVSIPEGDPANALLNLMGPIIINHRNCVGLQVAQMGDGPAQARIGDHMGATRAEGEMPQRDLRFTPVLDDDEERSTDKK